MKTWMLLVVAGVVAFTVAGCSWCRDMDADCCGGKKADCPSMQQDGGCSMMNAKDGAACPMQADKAK